MACTCKCQCCNNTDAAFAGPRPCLRSTQYQVSFRGFEGPVLFYLETVSNHRLEWHEHCNTTIPVAQALIACPAQIWKCFAASTFFSVLLHAAPDVSTVAMHSNQLLVFTDRLSSGETLQPGLSSIVIPAVTSHKLLHMAGSDTVIQVCSDMAMGRQWCC